MVRAFTLKRLCVSRADFSEWLGATKTSATSYLMARLHLPMRRPEDVIPFLGKQDLHWKEGRSAKLLIEQWFAAGGLPTSVSALLDRSGPFKGARMLEGWPERETELPWGRGKPTQTDLLALLKLANGELAVLGVEAKVDETLGPLVSSWLAEGGENRLARLTGLCALFGLAPDDTYAMRYQVLHRVAGSVLEAQRFGCSRAVVLVQSWCPKRTGLPDFQAFARALGLSLEADAISDPIEIGGIETRIGWVTGQI